MTFHASTEAPLVTFSRQVWTVASAALVCIALTAMFWHWAFGASQAAQDRRIDRLAEIIELQAVITVGDSAEQWQARADLRKLRHVIGRQ